jgi:hypothetical protein
MYIWMPMHLPNGAGLQLDNLRHDILRNREIRRINPFIYPTSTRRHHRLHARAREIPRRIPS